MDTGIIIFLVMICMTISALSAVGIYMYKVHGHSQDRIKTGTTTATKPTATAKAPASASSGSAPASSGSAPAAAAAADTAQAAAAKAAAAVVADKPAQQQARKEVVTRSVIQGIPVVGNIINSIF